MPSRLRLLAAVACVAVPGVALATTAIPLPEPGILELLAAGAVAGAIAWVRKRRK